MAQESFIAALHSLASYDPRKAAFRTWLYRIATNKIIDYWRRTPVQAISLDAPRHLGESGDVQGWADSLELADLRQVDIAQGEVERDLLRRILQQVAAAAPEAQEVFRLHLYGGYNFAQISAMSGDSESTVKARYYRLLGQLRKDFSDERA
ncbi:hypothetical protein KIMH_10240 [Bombiscardovia apis]|uniref:RNA polymerase sigma-70 region 2 domain-containing protein n=1 Tax=Bombiscardovia apis TaxID=2932182 RepID=A0ABM8BDD2_9BIFI|nr:hypothetical protein KIMH_10240 [Bombiscardovia apis]